MSELDETCRLTREHMSEVLDGVAEERLLEHVAECEACRDARFDAQQEVARIRLAGADYVAPEDMVERVLASVDVRATSEAHEEPAALKTPTEPAAPNASGADDVRGSAPTPSAVGTGSWARAHLRSGVLLATGLAVAAAVVGLWLRPSTQPSEAQLAAAWSATVTQVVSGFGSSRGLEVCNAEGGNCSPAKAGQTVAAGRSLRTDGLTRAKLELSDGTVLYLDRATSFRLAADELRRGKLLGGNLVADVRKIADQTARIELPAGHAEVLGTKFALRASDGFARVDVSRGEVKLVDPQEREVSVLAGEGAELYAGKAPRAGAVASLDEAMAWSDEAFVDEQEDSTEQLRGLGELRAKKPGATEELDGAVRLTRHAVKVRIASNIVKTTVEEVFTNTTDEVLEGIFRFPLPPQAQIERLALEVDGKLVEGAFVDRERASKIWRGAIVNSSKKQPPAKDEIIWVPGPWKDPALLEWQRGGRFELRIFPIPKRASRRIVLAYTESVRPHGDLRRYTYPLAHDPRGSTKVENFSVDIQLRGHDPDFGVRAHGYELEHRKIAGEATQLSYARQGFVPSGDLWLEYRLPGRDRELRAWAYTPTSADSSLQADSPYVALALRPELPRWAHDQKRAFVLAVDTSRSMYGEGYRRALQLAGHMVREMDREDRVTVLGCDVTCRKLPDGFVVPGEEAAESTQRFLSEITPEGASDLVNTLLEASELGQAALERSLRVVYVGDGTPTVGPVLPAFIRRELNQRLPARTTVHAVTVGAASDMSALEAATEAGGGVVVPYAPGQSMVRVAYSALGAAYGHSLRDISLKLPAGLVEVAPKTLGTIAPGGEALVVARMLEPRVVGKVELRGKVGGREYEQSYPLSLESTSAAGNAFVPRLFAAGQIAELERSASAENRQRVVALSSEFSVASRHTSLLVLESPAMFKAFGLDNTRRAPEWSGEDDVAASEADGEVTYAPAATKTVGTAARPGGSHAGGGGLGRAAPSLPRKKSSAPSSSAGDIEAPASEKTRRAAPASPLELLEPPRTSPRRGWVPMRRIWEPVANIHDGRRPLRGGSPEDRARALAKVQENPLSRAALKQLYITELLAGNLEQARDTAERWSAKDPLDPEALTARADVAAQLGNNALAIRILGSVVDMRPDDHKAQWRLARLHRWQGQPRLGCRYSSAVAQMRPSDVSLVALALRCARDTDNSQLFDDLFAMAPDSARAQLERELAKTVAEDQLSGEFRLEASWDGASHDLDLVIVHPDGYRVSWLGAPTRAIISARDVLSTSREGLALKGAKPGSYAIELVRDASAKGAVQGEVKLRIGKQVRSLPFTLAGSRVRVARVDLRMTSRLVPVNP